MFDSGKKGMIEKEKIRTILNTLGANFDPEELESQLSEKDPEGNTKITLILYLCCNLLAHIYNPYL